MIGVIWSIEWNNPYTEPPNGWPRRLIDVFRPEGNPETHKLPNQIQEILTRIGLGSGYGVHWQAVNKPPKRLSPEKLAIVRRKRLERRIRHKYPLLADQLIKEEINKKLDYYQGITKPDIDRKYDRIIKEEEDRIIRLIEEYKDEQGIGAVHGDGERSGGQIESTGGGTVCLC